MKSDMRKGRVFFYVKLCVYFLLLCGTSASAKQQSSAVKRKKPMKILMIVSAFPKLSSICAMNQMTGLIDRGHEVHVFAFEKGDCVKVQDDIIKYDLINKTTFGKLPASLDDYDIVMFQMGHQLLDLRKTHNFKGKIVVCMRGYDITGFLKENPHAYDYFFEACDLFLPVCNAFKKLLVKAGCAPNKIAVHYSSIDCSKFKFQEKKFSERSNVNIISAGRFVEKKGFIYSLVAVEQLLKKYPYLRYVIIGDGVLKEGHKQIIRLLSIDDKVQIYDWFTHSEYIDILKKSHFCVMPSVTARNNNQEGIANVLKEAMAMGIIVIATDHSGNSELIEDGVTGFLVPERDSAAIYNVLEYLLNNPSKWASIQAAARKVVIKKFDKEKQNDNLEALLYNLVYGDKEETSLSI